jgi:hypothetical protein
MGAIANTLRANLREMAQSDARFYRELEADLAAIPAPRGRRALPDATRIEDAIRLLEAHGYTVTPPRG